MILSTTDSYTRAIVHHDWAIRQDYIARVQYKDGDWFCEVATPDRGWVRFDS